MEYTAEELTDDSDDEKRPAKAEKAAERKAGLRKRKRTQQLPETGRMGIVTPHPSGSSSRLFLLYLVAVRGGRLRQLRVQ